MIDFGGGDWGYDFKSAFQALGVVGLKPDFSKMSIPKQPEIEVNLHICGD